MIEKIYDLINLTHVDSKIHTSVQLISDSVTNNITDVVILIMGIKNSQIRSNKKRNYDLYRYDLMFYQKRTQEIDEILNYR